MPEVTVWSEYANLESEVPRWKILCLPQSYEFPVSAYCPFCVKFTPRALFFSFSFFFIFLFLVISPYFSTIQYLCLILIQISLFLSKSHYCYLNVSVAWCCLITQVLKLIFLFPGRSAFCLNHIQHSEKVWSHFLFPNIKLNVIEFNDVD